ncbi:MAG: carbohydrate ABC transporter permease [Anaerolineae bacterium]
MTYNVYLATTSWSLVDRGASASWVGLRNFKTVLSDPLFQDSLKISCKFALASIVISLVLGLLLAYMVVGESKTMRVIRTLFLIPMFIPGVVAGTIWRMMLNVNAGIVNYFLGKVGIPPLTWFSAPATAWPSTVLVDLWMATPFVMILLAAGITTLPEDPIRAAMVDGASRWQIFRYITLPLLTPVIIVAILFRVFGAFFALDHIYTATQGGPGFSTNMISLHLFRHGLVHFKLSYVAAASCIMLVCALVVVWVLMLARGAAERSAGLG